MKRKRLLPLLSIAGCLLLASCGGETPNSQSSSSSVSSPEESQSSSTLPNQGTDYPRLDAEKDGIVEFQKQISVSSVLIDTAVGVHLSVGKTYELDFTFTDPNSGTSSEAIITSSVTGVATVSMPEGGKPTLTIHASGDTVLTIKDKEGFAQYKKIIKCSYDLTPDQMVDYLIETDHFQSWKYGGDNRQITFIDRTKAIMSGSDNGELLGDIEFTFKHEKYEFGSVTYQDSADEYFFKILDWSNSATSLNCVGFFIYKNGVMLHTMTNNQADAVFTEVTK